MKKNTDLQNVYQGDAAEINDLLCTDKLAVCIKKLNTYADSESVFCEFFGQSSEAFWLDSSSEVSDSSRFSYMGDASGPLSSIVYYKVKEKKLIVRKERFSSYAYSVFDFLDLMLKKLTLSADGVPFDFIGGFVGYFGYEMKAETCSRNVYDAITPDAAFIFADRIIVFDHEKQEMYLVCLHSEKNMDLAQLWIEQTQNKISTILQSPPLRVEENKNPVIFTMRHSREQYVARIEKCFAEINNGESYEICLTNEIKTSVDVDHLSLYRMLRKLNPAPFSAYIKFSNYSILCSSPERFLKIDKYRVAESKPIKGTVRRGNDEANDGFLCKNLQEDEKFRSENLMIVDLLRNDIGSVSEVGSVKVEKLMDVETYQTLHQLVSTIKGKLKNDITSIDCLKALFPGGSMTGAPKKRTLEIIDSLEDGPRGIYSGTIGFLSLNNRAEFNIVIRTIIAVEKELSIGVGGAIIALSDASEEFDEMLLKAKAPMQAIVQTACGEGHSDNFFICNFGCDCNNIFVKKNSKDKGCTVRAACVEDVTSIIVMIERLIRELTDSKNFKLKQDDCIRVCKQIVQGYIDGAIFVSHPQNNSNKLNGVITILNKAAIRVGGRYATIEELWVDPEYRSGGVGSLLMLAAEKYCESNRIRRIEVGLPPYNFNGYQSTSNFYMSNGFQIIGSRMKKIRCAES